MNTEKNSYTIIYASIMVILVAVGLTVAHEAMSSRQRQNEEIDKMQQILASIGIYPKGKKTIKEYDKHVTNACLITYDGDIVENSFGTSPKDKAFTANLPDIMGMPENKRELPIYFATVNNQEKIIIPMCGKGLWGPIWGYLSVNADGSEVYGSDFGNAGETPGLGAEISTLMFANRFKKKHLYRNNQFTSIAVVKPGKVDEEKDFVDGISGGTITSKAVGNMLFQSISNYKKFLDKIRAKTITLPLKNKNTK